jgi:hypothetical protein
VRRPRPRHRKAPANTLKKLHANSIRLMQPAQRAARTTDLRTVPTTYPSALDELAVPAACGAAAAAVVAAAASCDPQAVPQPPPCCRSASTMAVRPGTSPSLCPAPACTCLLTAAPTPCRGTCSRPQHTTAAQHVVVWQRHDSTCQQTYFSNFDQHSTAIM